VRAIRSQIDGVTGEIFACIIKSVHPASDKEIDLKQRHSRSYAGSFSEVLRLTLLPKRIALLAVAKKLFISNGLESRSKRNYQRRTGAKAISSMERWM
jgi:hypothetical protein